MVRRDGQGGRKRPLIRDGPTKCSCEVADPTEIAAANGQGRQVGIQLLLLNKPEPGECVYPNG